MTAKQRSWLDVDVKTTCLSPEAPSHASKQSFDKSNLLLSSAKPLIFQETKTPGYFWRTWNALAIACTNTWWLETLGLAFSAACLMTISAFLLQYDGRQIPQVIGGITLNTVISILAAGSKSALMFSVAGTMGQCKWCWFLLNPSQRRPFYDMQRLDEATRGPLGSLRLLVKSTVLSLAAIGAVIVVLGLTYDPIIQQLVSYPLRPANTSVDAVTRQAFGVMTPATNDLLAGFYGLPFQRTPVCLSGNCTWDPFQSIGWCGKCEDYSGLVTSPDCNFSMQDILENPSNSTRNCTFRLPIGEPFTGTLKTTIISASDDGTSVPAEVNTTAVWPLTAINDTDLYLESFHKYLSGDNYFLGHKNPLLAVGHVSWVGAREAFPEFPLDRPLVEMFRAQACIMTPCVKEYSISMANGIPTVNVTGEDYGILSLTINSTAFGDYQELECWRPTTSDFSDIDQELAAQYPIGIYSNETSMAWCALGDWMTTARYKILDFFAGFPRAGFVGENGVASLAVLHNDVPRLTDLWELWNNDMSQLLDPLMTSMTRPNLFSKVENVAGYVNGTVWSERSFVDVRWPWMILPVSLNILGGILLGLAAFYTSRHNLPLWKSSILAVAYHGLEDDHFDPHTYTTTSEMAEAARMTSVSLASSGENGRFLLRR